MGRLALTFFPLKIHVDHFGVRNPPLFPPGYVVQVAQVTVTPVLYMADGTRYELSPVVLGAAGVTNVDINAALQSAPASVQQHLSDTGSAAIEYMWPWKGAVLATVENLDVPRSLVFHFSLQQPSKTALKPNKIVTEGLWWKHDADIGGFVAITNTTKTAITSHFSLFPSNTGHHVEKDVILAANSTQMIDLNLISANSDLPPAKAVLPSVTKVVSSICDFRWLRECGDWVLCQNSVYLSTVNSDQNPVLCRCCGNDGRRC